MESQEEPRICRFFGSRNGCRHGISCRYLHTSDFGLPPPPPPPPPPRQMSENNICRFFQNGYCRNGSLCRFLHPNSENLVDRRGLGEIHELASSQKDLEESNYTQQRVKENLSQEEVCGICLESDIETYGLLMGCDHLFCIVCISAWRSEANPRGSSQSELKAKRGCPTCRQHSDFVIPSSQFVTGDIKALLIQERLEIKKTIPCRDWNRDKRCRFGSHCHYAHLDENGQDCKPRQREQERHQPLRFDTLEEIIALMRDVYYDELDDNDGDDDQEHEFRLGNYSDDSSPNLHVYGPRLAEFEEDWESPSGGDEDGYDSDQYAQHHQEDLTHQHQDEADSNEDQDQYEIPYYVETGDHEVEVDSDEATGYYYEVDAPYTAHSHADHAENYCESAEDVHGDYQEQDDDDGCYFQNDYGDDFGGGGDDGDGYDENEDGGGYDYDGGDDYGGDCGYGDY